MVLEFIIAVVCAIICVVCGYYVGVIAGKQETCDIVKENNKEVNCMSLDKENKTFRHPYLSRLRLDKPAQDCKLEEIFS